MFYVQIGDLRLIEGFSHLRDIIPHLGTMSLVMPRREFSPEKWHGNWIISLPEIHPAPSRQL